MHWTILKHDPFTGEWTPVQNERGESITLTSEAMAIIKARALERVYKGVLYMAAPVEKAVA